MGFRRHMKKIVEKSAHGMSKVLSATNYIADYEINDAKLTNSNGLVRNVCNTVEGVNNSNNQKKVLLCHDICTNGGNVIESIGNNVQNIKVASYQKEVEEVKTIAGGATSIVNEVIRDVAEYKTEKIRIKAQQTEVTCNTICELIKAFKD